MFRFPVVLPAGFMIPTMAFYLASAEVYGATLPCESGTNYEAMCNMAPAEDLEPTPDGRFLFMSITPGLDGSQKSRLQILDRKSNKAQDVTIAFEPESGWGDSACLVPEAPVGAHGIHLSERPDGRYQLLVVNHNEREAIEFLEVVPDRDSWSVTWRGCVESRDKGRFNDVAAIPGASRGFVATVMFEAESMHNPPPMDELLNGEDTGYLMSWIPGQGLRKIPGSDAPFPNGIQISADGRYAWFAAWTAREVHQFDLQEQRTRAQVPVGFMPDNLSWVTPDRLLVAGILSAETFSHCMTNRISDCPFGVKVASLGVDGQTSQTLFTGNAGVLGGASVAVEVDNYIYVGAFGGDRMIRLPKPRF